MTTRRAVLGALALLGPAGRAAARPAAQEGQPMPRLTVFPDRAEYAPLERITLRLQIANDGPTVLDLPHPELPGGLPVYRLHGPSFPDGRRFRGLRPEAVVRFDGTPPPPPRLRLEAGEDWTGSIPLRDDIQPGLPGEYHLTATLDPKAERFEAPVQGFRVQAFAPRAAHLGWGLPPFGPGQGQGAFLQPGGTAAEGAMLYTFEYHEQRPDIRAMGEIVPVARIRLPATATDLGVPARNSPFFDELLNWIVWREGCTIAALVNTAEQPRIALPFEIGPLVMPPLKTTGGPVEVLFLAPERNGIGLVRFPATGEPALAWRMRLPAVAGAITVALGPAATGSERHLVLAAETPAGEVAVFAARYGADQPPAVMATATAPGLRLLPGTTPGLFTCPTGEALFGVLVQRPAGLQPASLALLEARFPATAGTAPAITLRELGPVAAVPAGGIVLYSPAPDGSLARRDAAILLRDSLLLRMPDVGPAAPIGFADPPTVPLRLAPGRQGAYILLNSPERGPYFEAF